MRVSQGAAAQSQRAHQNGGAAQRLRLRMPRDGGAQRAVHILCTVHRGVRRDAVSARARARTSADVMKVSVAASTWTRSPAAAAASTLALVSSSAAMRCVAPSARTVAFSRRSTHLLRGIKLCHLLGLHRATVCGNTLHAM